MARCSVDRRLTARRVAATHGLIDILINSGELNRSIHRGELGTVSCCEAMQQEIKPRDVVVLDRHSGAGMTVRKGEPWAHTSITNEIIVTTRELGFQTTDSKGKPRSYSPHGLRHLCGIELGMPVHPTTRSQRCSGIRP